ncbi:MAG TPA: hypothetical protein VF578_22775 [Methylomirabilota bacterium]
MDRAAESARACSLGPGPFFFSGRPPFIHGTVSVHNRSDERVRVRSMTLGAAGLAPYHGRGAGAAREPANGPAADVPSDLEIRPSRRVGPFERASVPAYVRVDRFTPPGEYEARVRFGDQHAPAVIVVQESHRLDLVPDRITVTAAAGETIVRRVAITNQGNVPFSTRKAALAPLEALGMLHRSLAVALTEAGHDGHAKFLDRFVRELAEHEVPPAKVKVEIQDQEIAPGETKLVELSIRLPADLKRRRSYTSRIDFREKRLAVEVNVEGSADQSTARPRRAAG